MRRCRRPTAPPTARRGGRARLLRRYGIVCWRLLEREAGWLPPWRDLVRVLRRLEARGEIRGGRFVDGLTGEQFALPEAVEALRRVRRAPHDGAFVVLAAADPANLLGTLLPGPKLPRIAGARVIWRDGLPLATLAADRIEWLLPVEPAERHAAERLLRLDPALRHGSVLAGGMLPAAAPAPAPDAG